MRLGAAGYTSQPLHAPDDRDGPRLLADGQERYAVLGQAYAEVRLVEGLVANVFRKEYSTPFLNRNDGRMTPNTFEAYTLVGEASVAGGALRSGGGWVTKIKERNSERFRSLGEAAGAGVERGVGLLGFHWIGRNASFGAVEYYGEDLMNVAYVEAKVTGSLMEGVERRLRPGRRRARPRPAMAPRGLARTLAPGAIRSRRSSGEECLDEEVRLVLNDDVSLP